MATKKDVHTVKNTEGSGWVNKVSGKAEHVIHGSDGKIRAKNTYGKDPFPPRG